MLKDDASTTALQAVFRPPLRLVKYYSFWAVRWAGLLALLAYWAKSGVAYLEHATNLDQYIDKAFILSGFALLLCGAIVREISLTRKEKYANVFPRIEAINGTIRELYTFLHSINIDDIHDGKQFDKNVRSRIVSILDNIAELFSMLTGTACRSSIKCILKDNSNVFVYAFARDNHSSEANAKRDKERYEKKSDPIEGNEDFHSIFEEDVVHYIENDLTTKQGYQNTSFTVFGRTSTSNGRILRLCSSILRACGISGDWKLPYRSAMVFPIQQRESRHLSFAPPGCIGFLAIDSEFRNVFKARFDGPLGASLAHALFAPLVRYEHVLEEMREREVTNE